MEISGHRTRSHLRPLHIVSERDNQDDLRLTHGYRECERNAGVQWSIDFNPHPRAWHVVSDDIIYAGSEMNVVTDEILKSLKSLQVSPCECSAKNPDSDYPNQHTKACPRFQAMHCWCPSATGPGQPHLSGCSHFKRPIIHAIGSYHDWDLMEESEPQYTKIDPEAWTFGEMAAKMIADATAAAESASGQGELPAAEIKPDSIGLIELAHAMSQKEKQALAYVQAHAMQLAKSHVAAQAQAEAHIQAQAKAQAQKLQMMCGIHALGTLEPLAVDVLTVSDIKAAFKKAYKALDKAIGITEPDEPELCTCAAASGVIGHAGFCPLGEKA
jgi:hypothetical protein